MSEPGPVIAEVVALERLIAGGDLSRDEMGGLMGRLMDGELSEVYKAALLTALATKGEVASEITGAADALRRRLVRIPHSVRGVVDTCGTGGDGRRTFNISTAAALVAAGAGVPVAKHGNRSVSSRCGSADVLEAAGVEVDVSAVEAARTLDEVGLCFLFAPSYHPAMREVMPVRRALAVRTLFNVLGPLTNPAGARRQVVGVYAEHLVGVVAAVLVDLGAAHALVVHGSDGLDELTTTGPTRVAEATPRGVEEFEVLPEDVGLRRCRPPELEGGDPKHNAALLEAVLSGEPGPLADVTLLNAGAAIYVGGAASDLVAGVEQARRALGGGAARSKLEELRARRSL
jgi:anthranilate phosphoribosyltransferase